MVEDLESAPLLTAADLPAGWQMPDPTPIDPEHDSAEIDTALRYEQWVDPAPGLDRKLNSSHNNNDSGRWFLIQHVESSTRVLLRLQRQYVMGEEPKGEVRITGIVYLPEWVPGGRNCVEFMPSRCLRSHLCTGLRASRSCHSMSR